MFYTLLLVVCLFVLSSCGLRSGNSITMKQPPPKVPTPQRSITRSPTHIPQQVSTPISGSISGTTTSQTHSAEIASIHMIDFMTGWALQYPKDKYNDVPQVLHTTDGGVHWKHVTPNYTMQPIISPGIRADFLSASVAWVAILDNNVAAPSTATLIFRTIDGGQTWQGAIIPIPANQISDALQITAINLQDAWILFSKGENQTGAENVDLDSTTDGGKTWFKIASTDAPLDSLPVQGEKSGLSFLNASTGWATGWDYGNTNYPVWLYVTHDGGMTWQNQTLSLPPDLMGLWVLTMPPRFFSASDGIMPVLFARGANDEYFALYVTHDAGVSWHMATTVSMFLSISSGIALAPEAVDVIDMLSTRVVNGDGKVLCATNDGGEHWMKMSPNLPSRLGFTAILGVSFVSNKAGWLSGDTGLADPYTPFLFKTVDGGQTWTQLIYSVH